MATRRCWAAGGSSAWSTDPMEGGGEGGGSDGGETPEMGKKVEEVAKGRRMRRRTALVAVVGGCRTGKATRGE